MIKLKVDKLIFTVKLSCQIVTKKNIITLFFYVGTPQWFSLFLFIKSLYYLTQSIGFLQWFLNKPSIPFSSFLEVHSIGCIFHLSFCSNWAILSSKCIFWGARQWCQYKAFSFVLPQSMKISINCSRLPLKVEVCGSNLAVRQIFFMSDFSQKAWLCKTTITITTNQPLQLLNQQL